VNDAHGGQLQASHNDLPLERGCSVHNEADINPPRPQRLLTRAGESEEIVPHHADRTEGDRHEYRENRFVHYPLLSVDSKHRHVVTNRSRRESQHDWSLRLSTPSQTAVAALMPGQR